MPLLFCASLLSFPPFFLPQDVLEEMEAEYGKQREAVKAAAKELGLEVGPLATTAATTTGSDVLAAAVWCR